MNEPESTLTRPRESTVKRLFAFSRNQCAFEGCTESLADKNSVFGDICHIEGSKDGSARWRENQDPEERHGFENLVLLCKADHAKIDNDEDTYTVKYLKAMKHAHEEHSAPLPPDLVDRAVQLFIQKFEAEAVYAGAINVSAMTVGTLNVFQPHPGKTSDPASGETAVALLAPELARIVARQIYVLDRAVANFLSASTEHELPGDPWSTFRPTKPSQYPHAPACSELAGTDAVLLAEFYDKLQGLDDQVVQWHEASSYWDMNTWNVLMQGVAHSVEVGLRAADRFCPNRLVDPLVPVLGTLKSHGRSRLDTMKKVLDAHIQRWTARGEAMNAVRDSYRKGVRPGDYATELSKLVGGSRLAWMEAAKAANLCAAIPRNKADPLYGHQLQGLCLDEIVLFWLAMARQRRLRLDLQRQLLEAPRQRSPRSFRLETSTPCISAPSRAAR